MHRGGGRAIKELAIEGKRYHPSSGWYEKARVRIPGDSRRVRDTLGTDFRPKSTTTILPLNVTHSSRFLGGRTSRRFHCTIANHAERQGRKRIDITTTATGKKISLREKRYILV